MSSSSSAMSSNWISSSSPGPNVSVSLILAADETENASEKSHEYSRRPQSESNHATGSDCGVIHALNALHHHQGAVWKWDCHHFSTLHTLWLWLISGETLNSYFESSCMANRVALTLPLLCSCSWSGHHHGAATLLSPKIQYVCDVRWGPLLIKTCNYFPPLICKKTEYYTSPTGLTHYCLWKFMEVKQTPGLFIKETNSCSNINTASLKFLKNRLINVTRAA